MLECSANTRHSQTNDQTFPSCFGDKQLEGGPQRPIFSLLFHVVLCSTITTGPLTPICEICHEFTLLSRKPQQKNVLVFTNAKIVIMWMGSVFTVKEDEGGSKKTQGYPTFTERGLFLLLSMSPTAFLSPNSSQFWHESNSSQAFLTTWVLTCKWSADEWTSLELEIFL